MGVWKKLALAFGAVLAVCSILFVVGCGGNSGSGGPKKLYLFGTAVEYTGDLGGRDGADAKCLTDDNMPAAATVAYAFISVTAEDCIANMPENYNFPDDIPIVAPDGVTVIADNWADLLDGDIKVSLYDAGLLPASKNGEWWSGSDSDGTLNAANCNGWTEGSDVTAGMRGFPSVTDDAWLSMSTTLSNSNMYILGIAY